MTRFLSSIDSGRGGVIVRFPDGKPPADVLAMLKASGFRWSPGAKLWFRRTISGAADFLAALDRKCNPGRPDGACWTCGEPGYFRPEGAATPVYCDACHAEHRRLHEERAAKRENHDDPIDRMYEDQCRDVCGL
jgi:hypothetical protein